MVVLDSALVTLLFKFFLGVATFLSCHKKIEKTVEQNCFSRVDEKKKNAKICKESTRMR